MPHKFASIVVTLTLLVGMSACSQRTPATPSLTPITVQLQWIHQAQFAGLYAADQNGYYAQEGLAVTFIPGGSGVDSLSALLEGSVQFGTATADQVLVARAEGKPLKAFAVVYRRSPAVFMSLSSSGITRPQDFVGRTIRLPAPNAPTLHAMMAGLGISQDQYTEVDLPSDVEEFASGDIPIWAAYLNGLTVSVQRAGYEINIIYPDDYGVHFYSDTLIATDDFIAKNPDLVGRFLRASLKGWTFAVEDPGKIGPMVLKYVPDADPELANAQMIASIPLVNTGEDFIGWMKPEVWTAMGQTLREQGVVRNSLDVEQAYTVQFLEEIYGQ
jgi:ABC-type nitrate/sulfonate/bicarbonate transport system substrate-binding protein